MVEKRVYASAKETFFGLERHIFTRYWYAITHAFAIYGFYELFSFRVPLAVFAFGLLYGYLVAGLGLTVGGHRLWTHKSFKAKPLLKLLLIYMHTASGQLPVFEYVRVHRTHHKWADTEYDPHNAQRGFWYAHILWVMMKENPKVKEKRDAINFSDLDSDPFVRFQSKYYMQLAFVAMFVVPMTCYYYLWNDVDGNGPTFITLLASTLTQHVILTHFAFLANSATHLWGTQPYNNTMGMGREKRFLAMITFGEGFHNYHHVFPWDYKISEGGFGPFNLSTGFIELFAKLGLAYDLRTATPSMVEFKAKNLGDGTHPLYHEESEHKKTKDGEIKAGSWGLEDEDASPEDIKLLTVLYKARTG